MHGLTETALCQTPERGCLGGLQRKMQVEVTGCDPGVELHCTALQTGDSQESSGKESLRALTLRQGAQLPKWV